MKSGSPRSPAFLAALLAASLGPAAGRAQDAIFPPATPAPATPPAAVPEAPDQPVATDSTTKPLWEVGGIAAGAWLPDYPGADESHLHALPVPFVIYRGDFLRADEQGLRGRFYRSPRAELDVSLGGSLPTSSDDNHAREDMPDLDLMGEIGPNLRVNLARDPGRGRLDLELGARAVFTTDLDSVTYRGLVLAPELSWRALGRGFAGSRLRLGLGPIFATGRYMDYFYEVEPRFARPDREEYEAQTGYLGTRLQGSYTVPVSSWLSVFSGGRVDYLGGATNSGSPLLKSDLNVAGIVGVSFSVWRSRSRVSTRDDTFD